MGVALNGLTGEWKCTIRYRTPSLLIHVLVKWNCEFPTSCILLIYSLHWRWFVKAVIGKRLMAQGAPILIINHVGRKWKYQTIWWKRRGRDRCDMAVAIHSVDARTNRMTG